MSLQMINWPRTDRPHTTVVQAMSADGKIADASRSAARFPSAADKAHLEQQIAKADATLFGAGTLRAYGTTLPVTDTELIEARRSRHQSDQPVQIVCTATGNLNPRDRFFQQPVPRWLITTLEGLQTWKSHPQQPVPEQTQFEQILINERPFNWAKVMQDLRSGKVALSKAGSRLEIERLVVMGGGELVASLLAEDVIDELYLTVCPLLIGGKTAPTPVGGLGFVVARSPRLKLLSSRVEGDEIFLHYGVNCGVSRPVSKNAQIQ